MSRRKK